MKKSTISFSIELDEDNIPEKINWDATDRDPETPDETKSISVSLWDHDRKNTMRIDLWTKEMPVDEMKRFYIDCLSGMAQTILNATGDEFMASQLNETCQKLADYHTREMKQK